MPQGGITHRSRSVARRGQILVAALVLLAGCAYPAGFRSAGGGSHHHHTPTTVPTTTVPTPSNVLFDDEFNGSSLDLTKWQPNWLGPSNTAITKPINSAEASCYDPAQVSVSGGVLHLRAEARSCRANDGHTYAYASGLINSAAHFTFTYGHLEARVWLPGGTTTEDWPAFWADGTGTWPHTGELDVVEGLGGDDCWHFHSDAGGPGGCARLTTAAGWHVFAADWSPAKVSFTYDGAQVGSITGVVTGAPMYLIANLGLSASISPPIRTPSEMLVDYIRVTR